MSIVQDSLSKIQQLPERFTLLAEELNASSGMLISRQDERYVTLINSFFERNSIEATDANRMNFIGIIAVFLLLWLKTSGDLDFSKLGVTLHVNESEKIDYTFIKSNVDISYITEVLSRETPERFHYMEQPKALTCGSN